jgi:hypothetical protein
MEAVGIAESGFRIVDWRRRRASWSQVARVIMGVGLRFELPTRRTRRSVLPAGQVMPGTSKWTAFLLSACVPGAGQLAARSWTCLAWFAAAGLAAAAFARAGQIVDGGVWLTPLEIGMGIALCLLSAEHAKRLLEQGRHSCVVGSEVSCAGGRGRIVEVVITLTVVRSPEHLWNQISDLPRFLTIDPFHDEVTLMRDQPAKGVDLVLSHNAFGRRFLRFGRILAWREGVGYTFSDLSARGPRVGFPHVFMVRIEPRGDVARLTIRVRGRWTSRLVPVWLGRLWIRLVCREHARLLCKGL